jgi:hypothetical protein
MMVRFYYRKSKSKWNKKPEIIEFTKADARLIGVTFWMNHGLERQHALILINFWNSQESIDLKFWIEHRNLI